MEQLGALLFGLACVLGGLYALGRMHRWGDQRDAYQAGYQSGHQAGWLSAFRANLWTQRHAAVSHNAAPTLYLSRAAMPRDPDQTVELTRILDR